ncbi:hypothetical protein [Methylobacterium nodulans]|uniref:Uncharacterized protein n=1 Tax=Methylobacterium nodulans (strain LMG 21967 / CNCM I-2342 / ORS 2060) TaxID=460265 RepID=B8IXX7_METNO|nr:hypothetical protein [Methylobacterium nodulans]ACL63267.1 conserved hypothetical protein [Methylobacterium nodulans ORS 2060]
MPNRVFAVRKGHDGWGVYSQHTGEPVRVNGREQTGLARETALQLVSSLRMLAFFEARCGDRAVIRPHSIH